MQGVFFTFEQVEEDVFRTTTLSTPRQGSLQAAYGGLIFAQALAAAENTVEEKMKPHAMHSFFLLNVNTSIPVQYHVRRIRDGRSYCTRTVEAEQEGEYVFILQISFNRIERDSAVHQDAMPNITSWKELKSTDEAIRDLRAKITEGRIRLNPSSERYMRFYENLANHSTKDFFEIRHHSVEQLLGIGEPSKSRTFYSWVKTYGDLGSCEKLHRYLMAYISDATMAGSAFRPHLVNDFYPSMMFSLDHNVWMHQHLMRADQWMLFENTSAVAGRGRAMITGKLWNENGILVLSCTQEMAIRGRGVVSQI
ncbi:hypothetical protein KIN20_011902 [Parelaphostrongylus tenuis]|uniref:Acyl-CoA thioesterase II n=1 Tax=Parelaphostrongylus tenuis TaxID=148309 RepID=A0AAD5N0P2_PARTN|nr:hypothetical protein KIN20_011902 [Parelaphostrongylus tenuis]